MNVIASALVSETPRLSCTALNFFLNIDGQMADDDEEEDKQETAQSAVSFLFLFFFSICLVVTFSSYGVCRAAAA